MISWAQQYCISVRGKLATAGQWADGDLGFADKRQRHFLGHDVAAEDPSEGVAHETLQPALEALSPTHPVPLLSIGVLLVPTIVSVIRARGSHEASITCPGASIDYPGCVL